MKDDDALRLAAELATLTLDRLRGGSIPAPSGASAPPRGVRPAESTVNQEWFSAREIAAYLGMTVGAVYAAFERGQIPGHRLGRRRGLRFRKAEVERALAARRAGITVRGMDRSVHPADDDAVACAVARKGGGKQ